MFRSDDVQEQRRLFYVALTRARDRLVVTLPAGTRCGFVDEVLRVGHATWTESGMDGA